MKTRNGFVSNSSSSSFIVRRYDFVQKGTKSVKVKLTTTKQDNTLKKFGFRKTIVNSPEQIPDFCDKKAWKDEEKLLKNKSLHRLGWNYCYEIICNQDDVIIFLIKEKIPFVASVHYGHETFLYVPENDDLYIATNYGTIMEMHGPTDSMELKSSSKPIKCVKGIDYIAKNNNI
jgi:hypothetical protein